MPRPLLIMLAGDAPAKIMDRTGNFDRMFLRMADYASLEISVKAVFKDEMPGEPEEYCGAIVTGSPAMVTDREPWSEKSGAWLYRAAASGCRILGVCYGHQLMAQAFGGAADYHPKGTEVGTFPVNLLPAASAHPLLPPLPARFKANLVHSQTVTALPPGATALAYSAEDPHQIVAYGPNAISVQFHPEFDQAATQRYIDLFAGADTRGGRERPVTLGLPAEETPEAASILQRFIDCCRAES